MPSGKVTEEGTFATTTTLFSPASNPEIVAERLGAASVCRLSSVPLALNTNTVAFLTVFSAFSSSSASSGGTTALVRGA